MQRHFSASHSHFWWPRRKDVPPELEKAHPTGRSLAVDTLSHKFVKSATQISKRIYILGAGNLGCFVAHALAGIPQRPPITLLMKHRQFQRWEGIGSRIDVTNHGMTETRRDFEVEVLRPLDDLSSAGENRFGTGSAYSTDTTQMKDSFGQENPSGPTWKEDTEEHLIANPFLDESDSIIEGSQAQATGSDAATPPDSIFEASEPLNQEDEINAWFAGPVEESQDGKAVKLDPESTNAEGSEEIIYNLIVSVKAPQTVKAIQRIAHRLTRGSTIMFLQNGMGILDEVNEQLFPDEEYRPTYIIGVVTHGLYSNGPFAVEHAGEGTIALGAMPRMLRNKPIEKETLSELAPSARYLIRTMTRTPVFVAIGYPPTGLLQQQLDKLAVNCIINPITAIIDCKNGALLSNMYFTRVIRLLLAEISIVIQSLPELKNVPNVKMRFDTLRLERIVFSIANKTAENHSSMLQDVKLGRQTEIDYINGYIIRRGEEMGIHCVMNYMLMHMVKGKNKIRGLEQAELLPLAGRSRGR